jgi:hypothetical protein
VHETWWPSLLAHIPQEKRWEDADVVVAELKNVDANGRRDGERRTFTALVPLADLDAVLKNLANVDSSLSSSGPFPVAGAAGVYEPKFWIAAKELPRDRYEPLVLAWTANNITTVAPSAGFLMTYALAPRNVKDATHYDDVTGPVRDVVQVSAPSLYSTPDRTTARVTIARDYLEDYLSLRGAALIELYWEIAFGKADEDALEALAGRKGAEFQFSDRLIVLNNTHPEYFSVQVFGARLLRKPERLPISDDPLKKEGLIWPGFDEPINKERAAKLRLPDFVYVRDAVLATYEGAKGFDVSPSSGGVHFGVQWSVGFVNRIGRDLLRLELKKLYEGAPPPVIRHWHGFAIPAPGNVDALLGARNIAIRAQQLVAVFLDLGDELARIASRLVGSAFVGEDFVGLNRATLDYQGWWTDVHVEPITRHAPLSMTRDDFLERCVALSNLILEGLSQSDIRLLVDAAGVPPAQTAKFRTLKLVDIVVRLAQVANATGLQVGDAEADLWERLQTDGTDPAQPLTRLFALNDLRQVKSHKKNETEATIESAFERFGIDPGGVASGYGATLDKLYDQLIEEIRGVAETLRQLP